MIALQGEDLEHQNLVIAGPTTLGWVQLQIPEEEHSLPEVLEIDVGGDFIQWIVLHCLLLKP
jgi:hypothetical protein